MNQDYADLTLDELLRDSVTQQVMRADRVDPAALAAMLKVVAARLGPASATSVRQPSRRGGLLGRLPTFSRRQGAGSGCFARAGTGPQSQVCGAR